MAESVFTETTRILQEQARQHSAVLVSFSGGKDSLAVLDLCSRAFGHIVAFYMYLVPGLRHIEERLAWAREKYKVEILQYPHWVFFKCLRNGIFCPNHISYDDLPEIKLDDIYQMVMEETGIKAIAHGGKTADGLWRRRLFANTTNWKHMVYPIKGWSKYDVLAYLHTQKIPIPQESVDNTKSGMDLTTPTMLWLHDNYPDDFEKVKKIFPYVEAIVWRRQWYGVK